jgi:hypothetical protein
MDVRTNGNSHNVAIAALLKLCQAEFDFFSRTPMRRLRRLEVCSKTLLCPKSPFCRCAESLIRVLAQKMRPRNLKKKPAAVRQIIEVQFHLQ